MKVITDSKIDSSKMVAHYRIERFHRAAVVISILSSVAFMHEDCAGKF